MLRRAAGAPLENRRKAPRVRCRLNCTLVMRRKRIPARVLDVSEGGLCVLSPVKLDAKQRVKLTIDVPPRGPVDVDATAWNVRPVKGRGKKTWSIGMMVNEAGEGFDALLPKAPPNALAGGDEAPPEAIDVAPNAGDVLQEIELQSEELSAEWEESAAEWDQLFAEAEEMFSGNGSDAGLQMYRVRVKATDGPRTRTLTLSAASETEARDQAHADLEGSWKILEVEPA